MTIDETPKYTRADPSGDSRAPIRGRGRMSFRRCLWFPPWVSPVLIAMVYDFVTRRRVHKVYRIGIVILLIGFSRVFFVESETWLRIGRPLLAIFMK
jgi:hypothetical protein